MNKLYLPIVYFGHTRKKGKNNICILLANATICLNLSLIGFSI